MVEELLTMHRVAAVLGRLREVAAPNETGPFKLVTSLGQPATKEEVFRSWKGREMPQDLVEAWITCREARLFEDVDYGQWGLRILPPDESAERTARELASRTEDFAPNDIVVAEFLGDQELLVRSPGSFGRRGVLIALPLDPREDWFGAGRTLADFFEHYVDANGDKFWEGDRG